MLPSRRVVWSQKIITSGTSNRTVALIIGATGQDSDYLAELLLDKGYTVHGLKRRSSMKPVDGRLRNRGSFGNGVRVDRLARLWVVIATVVGFTSEIDAFKRRVCQQNLQCFLPSRRYCPAEPGAGGSGT